MHYVTASIGAADDPGEQSPRPPANLSAQFYLSLAGQPLGVSALCRVDRTVNMLERAMTQLPDIRIVFFLVDICMRLLQGLNRLQQPAAVFFDIDRGMIIEILGVIDGSPLDLPIAASISLMATSSSPVTPGSPGW